MEGEDAYEAAWHLPRWSVALLAASALTLAVAVVLRWWLLGVAAVLVGFAGVWFPVLKSKDVRGDGPRA